MKELLQQLAAGRPLSADQAEGAFEQIMTGAASPAQTGAMLALMQARAGGPAVSEIVGVVRVMRSKVRRVHVPDGLTAIDTCGMGGTGSSFFNISTAAAIVAAAAGRPQGVVVAKHGNRAITSRTGSSQLLEQLGVNLTCDDDTLTQCLEEAGVCFCFAPAHHAAMKHAMPIRQELGFRTIFNLVGPLTSPALVKRQLIGVPSTELAETIAQVLLELGHEHALIVHSKLPDGTPLGELTSFGPASVSELHHGMIKSYRLDPETLGLPLAITRSVTVDGPEQSAAIVRGIFDGEHGPARDIVLLNAAAALKIAGLVKRYDDGLAMAAEAVDSGAARQTLAKLVEVSQAG